MTQNLFRNCVTFQNNTSDISSEFFFYNYRKRFFLIPTQYILRVVHSVKKASDQKIPHPLATIYGHTHKLILYFSLFNVGCKE